MNILHLISSPRKGASYSIQLGNALVEKLQAANQSKIGQVIGRFDDDTLRRLARALTVTLGLTEL